MAIYEFKCKECDYTIDLRERTTDKSCDECGGVMQRVFAVFGICLVGSGFYRTDK